MPDWFTQTLNALPALLWIYIGVGLPWSLVILPRRDWRDWPLVAAASLAFGPALLTVWMFVLGTLGQNHDPNAGATPNPMQTILPLHTGGEALLRPELILAGTAILALVGIVLAWWRYRQSNAAVGADPSVGPVKDRTPLHADEKLLIALIVIATLARWVITSWLPFGSWDPLWVYGYQARIYTLAGYIPADIGYYPQFLQLQYAYPQIVAAGGISDHAARAVMPFLQIGSILTVYVLGSRLFNRRTGIIAAALWALYPHFGYWTRVGDLEIPLTFAFTGAATFFLTAWMLAVDNTTKYHRRYALIAGLFFGVAMWTKPTAGAFVWGVVLLVVVDFLRVRGNLRRWWPRFEVAALTGLASIPLGALWYVRNILSGHDAVVFPPSIWLTRAERSGAEFGWPLLALALLLAYLHLGPFQRRPDWRGTLAGGVLIGLGVLPSIINPARMGLFEWVAFAAGIAVIAWTLWRYVDQGRTHGYAPTDHISDGGVGVAPRGGPVTRLPLITTNHTIRTLFWSSLLALPYFVTWFYSYSYHYRLSFAIVPLMLLPAAVILARWIQPDRVGRWHFPRRFAYALLVVLLAAPGVAIAIYDEGLGWDWLWTIPPPDDYSEAGLLGVRDTLQAYIDETGELPVVIAPGLQPLPFFFPQAEIYVTRTPRQFEDVEGVTHFVNGNVAAETYRDSGEVSPFQNAFYASLPRENVATNTGTFADESFFYEVYELHPERRFNPPTEGAGPGATEVVFGDFARYVAHTVEQSALSRGGIVVNIWWLALKPAPKDYAVFVHFVKDGDTETVWAQADGPVEPTPFGWYATTLWDAGEFIIDRRQFFLQNPDTPEGSDYRLHIGFYDPDTGERLPVTVDGEPAGTGYLLESVFSR